MDPGPNGSARRRQCRARIEITTNVATGESRILQRLRLYAISHSLFPPTTLRAAIHRLGFVQADPIRSPARAQDLILRHRVQDYRAGDLEQRYRTLKIEEDYLYAYGFVPRAVWRLIHPRDTQDLSPLEKKVLAVISKFGKMHPRELEAHFGRKRVVNAWGGYSKETTHALDRLHYRGLLRIAGREHGIRIYEPTTFTITSLSPVRRLRRLILVHASILAPVLENTLQSNISRYRRIGNPREILATLIRTGELEKEIADGLTYLWPAAKGSPEDELRSVRFLALKLSRLAARLKAETGKTESDRAQHTLLAAEIQRFLDRPAEALKPIYAADAPPGAPIGDEPMDWLAAPPYYSREERNQ